VEADVKLSSPVPIRFSSDFRTFLLMPKLFMSSSLEKDLGDE